MFYAAFTDQDGRLHSNLYSSYPAYFAETFSPDIEVYVVIPFKLYGKTYAARKECARELAARFQAENRPGLSWAEVAEITAYFEKIGRRYGLLREFQENCIC